MKKIIPVIVVVVIAAAVWFAIASRGGDGERRQAGQPPAGSGSGQGAQPRTGGAAGEGAGGLTVKGPGASDSEDEEDLADVEEKSATELYKTADEALKAIKDAAANYDDLVLDQFTELGENCAWCDNFYTSVKELMLSPDTKTDQRSYYAEVLAISGRVENLKALVEAIGGAKNQEEADLYAEALELATGRDDVVKYLGAQLSSKNETLKEASVAAITNQGSRLAVELLHNHTLEKGDPDGYYSMGIGLGEIVPDEEAWPYLQELVTKRDAYSHLAVKSLLNAGLDGLKTVIDIISNSKDADFDKEMLKGAKDHVPFDDNIVAYLKEQAEKSPSATARWFAQATLDDLAQAEEQQEAEMQEDDEDSPPFTPLKPE